jgi:hypothetical protein
VKTTRFLSLTLLIAAAAGTAAAQDRVFGGGIPAACMQSANSQADLWKQQGINQNVIEKNYQALLAICSGDNHAAAAFIGAANFDYARYARLVSKDLITTGQYIALWRDHNRKLRLARTTPNWILEYVKGDADGDLVPDSMDRCPGTPDLTPTDDAGCPVREVPPGPSSQDLHTALNSLNMISSKACDGAPAPEGSSPLKFGYDKEAMDSILNPLASFKGTFAFAVSKVTNQPAGCPVFYQVEVRWSNPAFPPQPDQVFNLVYRESENNDPLQNPNRMVFRAAYNAPGPFGQAYMADLTKWYLTCEVRVRAMNGDGLSSGWSQPYTATVQPLSPFSSRPTFNEN